MALPSSITTAINSDVKSLAGREGRLFRINGGKPPTTPARKPAHSFSTQGKSATVAPTPFKFAGGNATATQHAGTITVAAFGNLVAGTSTLTVIEYDAAGNVTTTTVFTFVSGAPSGNQIQIGASNDATATNIEAAIEALASISSSVATNVVTYQGLSTGEQVAISTNAPTALTLATTDTGDTGRGSLTIQCVGDTFVAGTGNEIMISMPVNGVDRNVRFIYYTQSGDTTKNAVLLGMKNVLTAVLNNTSVSAVFGEVFGLGPDDTTLQLQTAMQNLFGSTAAAAFFLVASSGEILTLVLGTIGVADVNVQGEVQIRNSLMSPLITIDQTTGIPQVEGVEDLGKFGTFNLSATQNFATIQTGTSRSPEDIPTTNTLECSFDLFDNARLQALAEGSASSAISLKDAKAVLSFNSSSLANIIAGKQLIFVFEDDKGGFGYLVLYRIYTGNFVFNANIGEAGAFQVACKPQAISGRADQFGYIRKAA